MPNEPVDLWGVADDVEDLAESWDPEQDVEVPAEAFTDQEEWIRRRMAALRFARADIAAQSAAYETEIARLQDQLAQIVGEPSTGDRSASGMWRSVESLEAQLKAFHASAIVREYSAWERRHADVPLADRPKPKLPSTIKTIHGRLRSGDPNKYRVKLCADADPAEVCAWLIDHGFGDAVTIIPEERKLDGRAAPGMVTVNEDGEAGIFASTGEACPGLRIEQVQRWFKVDVAEAP